MSIDVLHHTYPIKTPQTNEEPLLGTVPRLELYHADSAQYPLGQNTTLDSETERTETYSATQPACASLNLYAKGIMDETMIDERDTAAREKIISDRGMPMYDFSIKQRTPDGKVENYLWTVDIATDYRGEKFGRLACYLMCEDNYAPKNVGHNVDIWSDPDYRLKIGKILFEPQDDSPGGRLTDLDVRWAETTAHAIQPDTYYDTLEMPTSVAHTTGQAIDAIVEFSHPARTETRQLGAPPRVIGETALYANTVKLAA